MGKPINYFFQGNLVPISVRAENTRYRISRPTVARNKTISLSIKLRESGIGNRESGIGSRE
ncbi:MULTISPECIES: hypothetical protein [unclassified Moorena]|uniref:hypothetical protein n=1 Tax=unclassified Moorena TaxID=2683338 RepID=UPI0014182C18|nr:MULTISPECIES: hypothetical protein [unclassified Moorena]NEO12613.1 hypothetical protein [Moorena sp. SIO3E8]